MAERRRPEAGAKGTAGAEVGHAHDIWLCSAAAGGDEAEWSSRSLSCCVQESGLCPVAAGFGEPAKVYLGRNVIQSMLFYRKRRRVAESTLVGRDRMNGIGCFSLYGRNNHPKI